MKPFVASFSPDAWPEHAGRNGLGDGPGQGFGLLVQPG